MHYNANVVRGFYNDPNETLYNISAVGFLADERVLNVHVWTFLYTYK